jgi:hypothetical protein
MVVRASRGIPKWLRITSLIVGLLAATLAAVQGTYTTMSEHRTASAQLLQEKLDAKLDVTTYQRDRTADSAWKSETRDIMLDALCARSVDPRNHRCKQR